MSFFNVSTTLYVSERSAQDKGLVPVVAWLKNHGWTIGPAEINPQPAGVFNAFGTLAEAQPFEVMVSMIGATQTSAAKAVDDAAHATGNWSIGATAVASASDVATGLGNLAKGLGASADPNAPTSPLMSTVQIVAIGAAVVVGGIALVYLLSTLKGAAAAVKPA